MAQIKKSLFASFSSEKEVLASPENFWPAGRGHAI